MGKAGHRHITGLGDLLLLRVRVTALVITAILVAAATFYVTQKAYSPSVVHPAVSQPTRSVDADYQIKRLTNFKFIRPLLSAKPVHEYEGYYGIKKSVSDLIQFYKDQNILLSASVYMRDFDKSNWTAINRDEKFNPGSILKIAILMTILKHEEEHPGFLESSMAFIYKFKYAEPKVQAIVGKQIEFGRTYTHRELLKYMIEYSDNNAGELLWLSMDKALFTKMFDDLGLPKPDLNANDIPLSAQDCSAFMESLFNAAYLDDKHSEFAIDLLSKSSFKEGIVKGIPSDNLLIAHKFGESGTSKNKELHETGILYIKSRPYLITIMTRGKDNVDYSKLATVLQGISRTIYYNLIQK